MIMQHKFVDFIPDQIPFGVLFISIRYKTAVHKCVCGCDHEVVTPITPTDWKLTFDGETVSLSPSIGNWNFECRSHYWIIRNKVVHSRQWSNEKIEKERKKGEVKKNKFFFRKKKNKDDDERDSI